MPGIGAADSWWRTVVVYENADPCEGSFRGEPHQNRLLACHPLTAREWEHSVGVDVRYFVDDAKFICVSEQQFRTLFHGASAAHEGTFPVG